MQLPRTALFSRTCLMRTTISISIYLASCASASASEMLQGSLEYNAGPQIEEFKLAIQKSKDIPCEVKVMLERLTRVSQDDHMRVKVWSRMLREELNYYNPGTLRAIENIALSCQMPLKN